MQASGPRILLVRTSALGDVVHCLPVLQALRRTWPRARLAWVIEEAMAPLLAGHPHVDEIIIVRLRHWRHSPLATRTRREVLAMVGRLRRFRADVVLDLMGNHKGGVLARLAGGRRIGHARRHRREPSSALWIAEGVEPRGDHAVDRALSLLEPLGVPAEPVDFGGAHLVPRVPVETQRFLDHHKHPFALLQPGTGWANKTYPATSWGEVTRRLAAETGLRTLVAAGPGEQELAAAVIAASDGAAAAAPAGDLASLAALTRGARLFLGGDSGPLHLAHALGTPVLAVMGPTDPARHGPWGAAANALAVRLPCSYCYKRFDGPRACLLALSPRHIAERAVEILAAEESGGSPGDQRRKTMQ